MHILQEYGLHSCHDLCTYATHLGELKVLMLEYCPQIRIFHGMDKTLNGTSCLLGYKMIALLASCKGLHAAWCTPGH
jgi:hypothetical protein